MEQLKNDFLTIEVSSLGAELQSVKDLSGREYLWQGDARFWPRRSPILFPIVCGLWEGKYRLGNKEFAMERHGFARDSKFKLIKQSDTRVTYALESSEATLKVYPYHFILSVTYKLEKNRIHVIWHVHNIDKQEIHFQIGGHPAFKVPDMAEATPLAGALRFDNEGTVERIFGDVGGCIRPDRSPMECNKGVWKFTEESFKDDAVIIDRSQLHQISLLDKEQHAVVTVDFKAPAVGIWSPYGKNAPFVCIEPWYGIHDAVDYHGDFRNKYLMNHLQPGASFMSQYSITIGAI